jgi:hypothetical protein
MSVKISGWAYMKGLRKPMGDLPALILASFNMAAIPPKVGEEQEVPAEGERKREKG